MKTYLRNLFESFSQSLWLMPAASIAMAMLAAYLMLNWEATNIGEWQEIPLINRSGRDTSLAIVGAIVGSLITVAGVTFSITIVSLTLASSQFGPRLLRNFLQSRSSQITFGALIGSFVYGILIMPAMDEAWESGQAHPSVTLMIALACACVCLIVHYIHHVATSIQADSLVASVYRELERKIDSLPDRDATEEEEPDFQNGTVACRVLAERSGYLTAVDYCGLAKIASETETQFVLPRRPGHFVARGELVAEVFGRSVDEKTKSRIEGGIFIGDKRTPEQNPEFLVDQLVELALRAISPGINDPNTAIVCLDYLSAAMLQMATKSLPKSLTKDEEGTPRVFCPQTDFAGMIEDAFDQLRQSGESYPEIVIRIVESLRRIGEGLKDGDSRKRCLGRQLDQIAESEKRNASRTAKDRNDIDEAIERCRLALI